MGGMPTDSSPAPPLNARSLRAVRVRPTWGLEERRRWDHLVENHHYLPFQGLVGRGLRHVAELDGQWVALVGWQAGAFKLKARDRWIGWIPEQQFRRLHLIANNTRFVLLPGPHRPNLASRVLGLSLRRLSSDMRQLHGHPVLVAETFVDPSRFAGTCYRASNWLSLGMTRGYRRQPGGSARWSHHGQPKEIFLYPLQPDACQQLSRLEDAPDWSSQGESQPLSDDRLRSLFECLRRVKEFRKPRGKRYPLATLLAMAVAARLAGYRGVTAFAEFASRLTQKQLAALRAYYSQKLNRYTAPTTTTFHTVLARLPPDTLDWVLRQWAAQMSRDRAPVAVDGKQVRGASRHNPRGRTLLVAALEHGSGLVLGQEAVRHKSNEIPAVRTLVGQLNLAGRTVSLDALHVQADTVRLVVEQGQAHYLATAVKKNQPTLLEDLRAIDWDAPECVASQSETVDKAHGRIETRRCRSLDLTGQEWDGYADLPHRRQAFRIQRQRTHIKTGATSSEVTYSLTSLSPAEADSQRLMTLVRGHWEIENRLHHVRDLSWDEDRCRAHVGHLPRNLAAMTNAAISIVRYQGWFRYLPQAHRYYAHRQQAALRAVLHPLRA